MKTIDICYNKGQLVKFLDTNIKGKIYNIILNTDTNNDYYVVYKIIDSAGKEHSIKDVSLFIPIYSY